MKLDLTLTCPIRSTYRTQQVVGMFDLDVADKMSRSWCVDLPALDEDWSIGAIVGPSGSGKSVLTRKAYGSNFVSGYRWAKDSAIVDAFPKEMSIKAIRGMLNSVGFSSPPDWLKSYRVLSNGQRFRCDLARALLTKSKVVAFDEFTSVTDRQVAKFGSLAVAKTIKRGRTKDYAEKFVAVTCHYDVLSWLQPDWVLDLGAGANGRLARGWLQREQNAHRSIIGERPTLRFEVRRAKRAAWEAFKHHHYLSGKLHAAAVCYVATHDDVPIAFCATITLQGFARRRFITRVVVLPDYQGVGVGLALMDEVAKHEGDYIISTRSSHPALMKALTNRAGWTCTGFQKSAPKHTHGNYRGSAGR